MPPSPSRKSTIDSQHSESTKIAPIWHPGSSTKSSANTKGRASAGKSSMPNCSRTPRARCGATASIDAARQTAAPNLARIVVAIDPAASSGEDADETGIVIVGRDNQGHGYVLAVASGKHQPIEWAKIAIAAYQAHHADRIVAERNNGGA